MTQNEILKTKDQKPEELNCNVGVTIKEGVMEVLKIKKDILSLWPKIVEYIGLSEYESKVYLSLINLGTAGARKLSINCDVPRTKVYGTLKN